MTDLVEKFEIIEKYLQCQVENQDGWGDEGEIRPAYCLVLLEEIKGIVERYYAGDVMRFKETESAGVGVTKPKILFEVRSDEELVEKIVKIGFNYGYYAEQFSMKKKR